MTLPEVALILTDASPAILIVGMLIGFSRFKKLNIIYKYITAYLCLMFLADMASRIEVGLGDNNFFFFLVYSFTEAVFFLLFYNKVLFKKPHRGLLILGFIGLAYILSEIILFENVGAKEFQPYAKVVDNFIIILLTLGYFYEKINNYSNTRWENFQLNAVILAFFTINLILFLPLNFLINEATNLKFYFWLGLLFITVLFYLYLTIKLWKNGNSRKLSKKITPHI